MEKVPADSNCFIKVRNVDLYYPSTVFNGTTLKQQVFSWLTGKKRATKLEDVHAIRNLSLDIQEGERVGVIGFNGAGKSTLLKAIAGLYPIRSGEIQTAGEIRSMLELTLGFDMLSTGRDNIMYRGLMLGHTPDEVRAQADEIIRFADLGEFIDYPVTSYSSGMLVRLAFSITTTVRGEILLVDEVLSAGDAAFRERARERMLNVMDQAKILVMVLHDMDMIKQVCNRVILMQKGSIIADGEPGEVIQFYLNHLS